MPNRIIKESLCDSERIASLTDFEFRLWVGLITQADDAGRGDARPAYIKGHVFPFRERVTAKDIESALHALAAKGCVALYTVGGKPYFLFPSWARHQRIRECKPKFPGPENADACGDAKNSAASCGELPQAAAGCCINPNPNPNTNPNLNPGLDARAARFTPPSVEEVAAYCQERGNGVDAARFVDFYSSKGWMVGKSRMKDWKAAVRNWERSSDAKATPVKKPGYNVQHHDGDLSDLQKAAIQRMLGEEA